MIKGLWSLLLFILPLVAYKLHLDRGTYYGAIAVSYDTLHFGTSDHMRSRKEAQQAAMKACGEADCKVGLWFHDSCGALAIDKHKQGKKDGAWGANWAGTQDVAKAMALEKCRQYSRRGKCEIVKSYCSI